VTAPKHTVHRTKRGATQVGKGMRLGGYVRVSRSAALLLEIPAERQRAPTPSLVPGP
jgi:hypothetical protein